MNLRRALLSAALLAAAVASPAAAEADNGLVYTVSASTGVGVNQVHATCVFLTDQWTADYGATTVRGFAVADGSGSTTVTCSIQAAWWDDADTVTGTSKGAVAVAEGGAGYINQNSNATVCVTATGVFAGQPLTVRNCE